MRVERKKYENVQERKKSDKSSIRSCVKNHPFSAYANFFWKGRMCAYQGVRNVSFSENVNDGLWQTQLHAGWEFLNDINLDHMCFVHIWWGRPIA